LLSLAANIYKIAAGSIGRDHGCRPSRVGRGWRRRRGAAELRLSAPRRRQAKWHRHRSQANGTIPRRGGGRGPAAIIFRLAATSGPDRHGGIALAHPHRPFVEFPFPRPSEEGEANRYAAAGLGRMKIRFGLATYPAVSCFVCFAFDGGDKVRGEKVYKHSELGSEMPARRP